eukprot:SAG22_NODE_1393_length_4514_cov_2.889468_3_plen_160_part_00
MPATGLPLRLFQRALPRRELTACLSLVVVLPLLPPLPARAARVPSSTCLPAATPAETFVPPLLDPVLGDYLRNAPVCRKALPFCGASTVFLSKAVPLHVVLLPQDARDPEVLSLMATIVNTCKDAVTPRVPEVLAAVFECTLQMITANFEDFPDIRCGE